MSDDLLTTLRFEVDGSGVATGLTSVKRSITDLGNAVKDITDKTNAALGKVGTEELPVAKGLEKASKSIIKQTGDIEKAIATFGSTASTSLKQAYKDINAEEVRLRGMGIDAAIMNPYLEKLREVQKLTAAVAAQERTLAQGAAQAVEAENQRLAHTLELKRQIASVKTTVDKNNAAAQAAKQAEIEAQQKFKLLGLNNQIQAAQKAAADAQAAQSAKAIKDLKDLTAAQAAYRQEVINSELNFTHTGRGKSTAFLADKGQRLGFDSSFIEKELAGYKKVEDAAKAAFQAANPHIAEMSKRAADAGTSVKGLSASLRNVPAQFTDIIVSLQGGQAPLTVLLQQGGQLKDLFGGVGNAARALGGYVVGLINPFTATAAAVAAVGYAAYQASEDAKALNKSLILSNGASGTTIGELTKVAESLTATSIGAGKASEALAEFITAGVKAGDSLGEFTKTAIELERVGGASIKETAKAFADLGKDPLSNINVLTLATYRQVEALLEQGDKIGAVKVAQAALNQENERVTAGLRAQEGVLDTSTRYWKDLGVSVWDTVRGLSQAVLLTPKTGNEERQELQKRRDTYAAQGYDTTKEDARLAYFKRLDDAQKESVKNQTKEIELKTILANLDAKDEGTRKLRERNQLIADNTRLLEAGLISQKRYDDVLANFDKQKAPAKLAKESSPFDTEQAKAYAKYIEEFQQAALKAQNQTDGLTASQGKLVAMLSDPVFQSMPEAWKQTQLAAAYSAIAIEQNADATKLATKAHEDYLKKLGGDGAKETASLEARVQKQAQHNAEIGKTAEQIEAVRRASEEAITKELEGTEQVITALLEKNEALLDYGDSQSLLSGQAKEIYEIEVKSLREQIKLRKQLAKGYTEGETLEAAATAAKATTAEWKRGWEETDKLARDAFTSWAENGVSMADAIGKSLKKALLSAIYEATIKPIAFQLYTSIAGGGGAAGAVQAASGAGNALSGGSSLLSGLSSVTGAFGSSLSANFGATMNSFGSTIGLSIEGGLASIAEGTATSVASGLGSIAGALGPVAVGIGALSALKSAMDYKVEANGSAIVANLGGGSTVVANRNDYTQTGGLFGGGTTHNSEWSAASAELTAYMDAQVKLVTESARAYGTALGLPVGDLDNFKQQIEVSLTGLNADQAKEAINKAIGGFGDALVSANFGPALDGLKRSGETSSATLVRVASQLTTVNSTLGMLGGKLLSVDAAGIKAADGLVKAMGGLEAFQQQTASYYNDYYSEEEKRLNTAKDIQSQLANAGIEVTLEQVLDGTKEQFRALVESFTHSGADLGVAGQDAVAALMAVSSAFAKIAKVEPPKEQVAASSAASSSSEGNHGLESTYIGQYGSDFWKYETVAWMKESYASTLELIKNSPLKSLMESKGLAEELKGLKEQLRVSQLSAEELAAEEAAKAQAALEFVSPENLEVYKEILAIKEQLGQGGGSQSSAAQERETLQNEYNQLTMTSVELRALEREQIAEGNRELWDKIQAVKAAKLAEQATQDYKLQTLALMGEAGAAELKALQQSIDDKAKLEAGWTQQQIDSLHQLQAASEATAQAAEAAAKALELQKHKLGLQATLYELTGDKAAARAVLEAQRAIELAAMDPSLRELQQQVWGLQDAAKASSEALSTAQANANEAMAALRRAVDAQRKIYQVQVDAAQEAVNEIKSVFDILHSSVKDLYGSVDSTAKMQSKEARAFITQALGTAQATGYLPESKQLQEAIAAAKGGNDEFASQFEKDFAALTLAGDLSQMELIAGRQLTEAERTLEIAQAQLTTLDGILEKAQQELDAANGINTSILSVADAVANLHNAILLLAGAKGTSSGNIGSVAAEYLGTNSGGNGVSVYTEAQLAALTSDQAAFQLLAAVYSVASQKRADRGEAWAETFSAGDPYLASVQAELSALEAYYTAHTATNGRAWLHALGIGSYDVGTNYVPRDQIAKIHEGEAIIPRAYNPAAGGQTGNARLESLVEGLTKEVQRLQAIVNDGNKSNERIAEAVNGNPDRPMPIDVTENSAGLATA